MPQPSDIVGHPKEAEVKELLAKGVSIRKVAAATGFSHWAVGRYSRANAKPPMVKLEAPPTLSEDASPKERAIAHATWLKAQVDKAVRENAAIKDIASLSTQYTTTMRLVAQLSGAFEITAAQIVKSVDFQRAVRALKRAVGDNREVWARWEAELAVLLGEEPSS